MQRMSEAGMRAGFGLSVHEQTELMRVFIRYAPVALAMFDRDMRYILATQRWMRDYGLTESVVGRSHYDVFPEIPARWREAHRRGLAGEILHEEEDRFDRADGERRWLRWELRPWLSDANEVGGIVIFTEDITSRKRAEEEREQLHIDIVKRSQWLRAEQRFRALLNSAPDAMIVVNAKGQIVLANSQAGRLFGYASQELLEQPVEILLSDGARAIHIEHRTRFLLNPRVRSMGSGLELFGRRKDGSTFPAEISLSPLQTDDGLFVSGAIRDASDRKKAEEAMAHLAATVECAYDAIFSEDLAGLIRSWNPGAERMFGYSAGEVVGRDIRFLIPSEHEEDRLLERIRRGEEVEPYETVRRRKDGSLIDVWLTSSPLRDSRGAVIGVAKIARDLTERKELERKLMAEAQTDALTEATVRRRFRELAQRELARVRRHGGVISIVAIDVDHFKNINDTYGHAFGDEVLRALVRAWHEIMREEDVLGRWGGDEFLLLLPDTDDSMAATVAERMRMAIAGMALSAGAAAPLHVTVSIGVAASIADDSGIDALLIRADKALYAAKRAGRNAVRAFMLPLSSALAGQSSQTDTHVNR
jgi:diguanylate cyclase (GGDEF)-like protein/PAS domain S-box-containing protein